LAHPVHVYLKQGESAGFMHVQRSETQTRVALVRQQVQITAVLQQRDDANVRAVFDGIVQWCVAEFVFGVQLKSETHTSLDIDLEK
jgi:hypothetical protein